MASLTPAVAAACEGGGEGESGAHFSIGANPTKVKEKHVSIITITNISGVKATPASISWKTTGTWGGAPRTCLIEYEPIPFKGAECSFNTEDLGKAPNKEELYVVDENGKKSNTVTVTGE